ncbi:polysaccharide pyruvyl transferase CsaB [Thermosediminibacter litoriperuensis]|uniref:Polysaccharide pyruvyl transferase CsaB n=1 Tax=Thermosediminibacter litoriperuensis TaxID=291989 RepID=A0A5S5AWS7_9FIRM|nr:polysaccharide pyruvyl transferase CsaB [Thermosediminibacter litoriperuensis]TYP57815.1 polysaccharide pyruvyl transferase CsaB [Thermosediminibacter litoriperuensis]
MNKILVSGYYGFGNAGDEAILMAIVESLKKLDNNISIKALSANPKETKRMHGIDAVHRTNPFLVIKAIAEADLVLSGGGGLLQDVTSSRSIPYYLLIVYLAKKMGKRVMFYANGVGPVNRKLNKRLIAAVGNTVDLITVRDDNSRDQLMSLGVKNPPIYVTADPAFALKPVDDETGFGILRWKGINFDEGSLKIGVSVRPWNLGKNRQVIAETCDYLIKNHDATIVFLPMQFPQDYSESLEIMGLMKGKARVIDEPLGPRELLWISGQMDLLCGMRLHALIFGAIMGVPLLGLAYDPKVENFLKRVEQPSAGSPLDLNVVDLCHLFEEAIGRRTESRSKLLAKKDELEGLAYENARLALKLLEGGYEAGSR